MTRDEIIRKFPNASEAFIIANVSKPLAKLNAKGVRAAAKLERSSVSKPLEKNQNEETSSGRIHCRFTSVRKRLCDPDNVAVKWLLDCLRYCGAIPGDEPEKITLEIRQRKTAKDETEHTMIELFKPVTVDKSGDKKTEMK